MSRNQTPAQTPEGLLVIDKPFGLTSFDVIRALRAPLGTRALGHTGTLDPNATGVLCVCAGWALKLQRFLDDDVKVYRAIVRLGEVTETDDAEGKVLDVKPVSSTRADIEQVIQEHFLGHIEQRPPAYSAVKVGGERAYKRARRGERLALPPRPIRIDAMDVESFERNVVELLVTCGKGTYVRSIARDLGEKLGCGAHLQSLRRLVNGPFSVEQSIGLDELRELVESGQDAPFVRPMAMLAHLPLVRLSDRRRKELANGLIVPAPDSQQFDDDMNLARVGDGMGRLVTVARVERGEGQWLLRPVKGRPQA